MTRNYESIREERERSREKRKEEENGVKVKSDDEEDEEDDCTLSDCEECKSILKKINIDDYPKLNKYLLKYEELCKNSAWMIDVDFDQI